MKKISLIPVSILVLFMIFAAHKPVIQQKSVIWNLTDTMQIGKIRPVIIGKPQITTDLPYKGFSFNGTGDGVIMPVNPVEGWKEFTVEVLFYPSSKGIPAQRFVHFQDKSGNRGLIETRVRPEGQWCLDTYLHVGKTDKGVTLIDRNKLYPCDEWYWAALVYDGKIMKHFINGIEEDSGEIDFGPMESGVISLGVRLNQIYWFMGQISELRFHPKALSPDKLQKI